MNEDVLVEGEARTTARVLCSRCLAEMDLPLRGEFQALYVPQARAQAEPTKRRASEWEDQRVNFYSEATVDLADEVAQALLIELPMRPLCRPDCAGLCPTCGHNRNDGPCSCPPERGDDPWATLRRLFPPPDDANR
jgi:uncharacterized protein